MVHIGSLKDSKCRYSVLLLWCVSPEDRIALLFSSINEERQTKKHKNFCPTKKTKTQNIDF